jgi:hypothetical protein
MKHTEFLKVKGRVTYIEESGFIIRPHISGENCLRADIRSERMKELGFCEDNTLFIFSEIDDAYSFVEGWSAAMTFSKLAKTNK